jgi:hypothetical protein
VQLIAAWERVRRVCPDAHFSKLFCFIEFFVTWLVELGFRVIDCGKISNKDSNFFPKLGKFDVKLLYISHSTYIKQAPKVSTFKSQYEMLKLSTRLGSNYSSCTGRSSENICSSRGGPQGKGNTG